MKLLFCLSLLSIFPGGAFAASRTVYFNQSGLNSTVNGLSSPGGQSSCKITVSNPSAVSQQVQITTSVSSIDSWVSASTSVGGSFDSEAHTTSASFSCSGFSCTGSLSKDDSVTVIYNFSLYPARTSGTSVTTGNQKLRCSGSITATDSGNPGFVIASGVLITFVESAQMQTDGVTAGVAGTGTFGGIAVYTQVPIAVNRSKPF